MRFLSLRIGAGIGFSYFVCGKIATPVIRKLTGWEDFEK